MNQNPAPDTVPPPALADEDEDIDRITKEMMKLSDTSLAQVLSNIESKMANLNVGVKEEEVVKKDETKKVVRKCSICREEGHYAPTCPNKKD